MTSGFILLAGTKLFRECWASHYEVYELVAGPSAQMHLLYKHRACPHRRYGCISEAKWAPDGSELLLVFTMPQGSNGDGENENLDMEVSLSLQCDPCVSRQIPWSTAACDHVAMIPFWLGSETSATQQCTCPVSITANVLCRRCGWWRCGWQMCKASI